MIVSTQTTGLSIMRASRNGNPAKNTLAPPKGVIATLQSPLDIIVPDGSYGYFHTDDDDPSLRFVLFRKPGKTPLKPDFPYTVHIVRVPGRATAEARIVSLEPEEQALELGEAALVEPQKILKVADKKDSGPRVQGTVIRVYDGYAIATTDDGKEVFVHYSEKVDRSEHIELLIGDTLEFGLREEPGKERLRAKKFVIVKRADLNGTSPSEE